MKYFLLIALFIGSIAQPSQAKQRAALIGRLIVEPTDAALSGST